jgi:glycosyltransferase involved in cell wall biosynthesis
VTTTTILECSGVGDGGITRVLTQIVRWWEPGQAITVVSAPPGWTVPEGTAARVQIASHQAPSRVRSIVGSRTGLGKVTAGADPSTTRVVSLSPSAAMTGSHLPVTTIVHDLAFLLWPDGLSRAVKAYRRVSYSTAVQKSERLLCVSERTRHDLLGVYGVQPDRTRLWTPGSDLAAPGTLPAELADAGDYLLITGHAPHKGVELAVAALADLPGLTLAVLTGGRPAPETTELANRLGVADRVRLLPRLPDAEYAAAVHGARAFLMPSHFEGYGLPAAEALRLGTPTVISPDPALYEATGGHAVRMLTWTPQALRDALSQALNRPVIAPAGRTWADAAAELFAIAFREER